MSEMRAAVVIPCFNYGRYLAEAVESVVAQTSFGADGRLHTSTDGSTDDSREFAAAACRLPFGGFDPAHIHAAQRLGRSESATSAWRHTTAEYVLCLDADDRLDSASLKRVWRRWSGTRGRRSPMGKSSALTRRGRPAASGVDTQTDSTSTLSAAPRCFAAPHGSRSGYDTEIGHADWDLLDRLHRARLDRVRAAGALWHYRVHDGLYSSGR